MAQIYLALGSNVGNCHQSIADAIKLLQPTVADIQQAPLYITKAVGYTDQADFLNTVVSGQTNLEPLLLLGFVKDIEEKIGRQKRFRWGPREIDIDIIFYDSLVMDDSRLTIPHPRFAERDFVLKPLTDLAPDAVDPRTKLAVQVLYQNLPNNQRSIIRSEGQKVD